jgi:predicted acylesterase/phospholipase RssA
MTTHKQRTRLKTAPPQDIAVSLSGGGHRATLFGLGVLLALVDRGLNKQVKQIASVSGGSIANAFIASQIKFNDAKTTSEVFDKIATELVKIIVHKGVLTRSIIFVLLSGLIVPPLLFIVFAFHELMSWCLATPLVIAWLGMALLRGLVIEWLIEMRYFPPNIKFGLFPPKLSIVRKHLGDLRTSSLEHALCCTDLIKPSPVYFSSLSISKNHDSGIFVSRIEYPHCMIRCASSVPIASAVRASAAFPGIPPRLTHFKSTKEDVSYKNIIGGVVFDPTPHLNKTLLLADGGVWNNLGTQVLRELDAYPLRYGDMALIIADASVPLPKQRVIPYSIPIWSLIRSLLRVSNIQHENTVEPRLEMMRDRALEILVGSYRSIREQPRLNAIKDELHLSKEQMNTFLELNEHGYLRPTEQWDIPLSLCYAPDYPLLEIIARKRDISASIYDEYGAMQKAYDKYGELLDLSKIDVSKIGTHLDRIHENDAKGLLARGYLSAFLWSVALKPLEMEEVDLLDEIPGRLKAMVSAA